MEKEKAQKARTLLNNLERLEQAKGLYPPTHSIIEVSTFMANSKMMIPAKYNSRIFSEIDKIIADLEKEIEEL